MSGVVGFVVAMPEERRAVLSGLGRSAVQQLDGVFYYSGRFADTEFCLVESGMGCQAASAGAEGLVRYCNPELLVSAGFCGAVRPGLKVADLVVAQHLLRWNGEWLEDLGLPGLELMAARIVDRLKARGQQACHGSFVTTERIVSKGFIANKLPEQLGAPVLEMESSAVAEVASMHNIAFTGLRSVSDDAVMELGFSLDEFCDDQLRIRPGRVLQTCAKRPGIIPQLLRLAYNSSLAGKTLGKGAEILLGAYHERP